MTESGWVADFTCTEARNGIVEILINNLNALYDKLNASCNGADILDDPAEDILIIHCTFPENLQHYSDSVYIEHVNLSQHGQIYVKFPVQYMHPYFVNVSIQGHSHSVVIQNNTKTIITTFPISQYKKLRIASFLSYDGYKIGEIVRVRHPISNKIIDGQISNVFNDVYQVNHKYNIPISSIYPHTTDLKYTIKWVTICNGINLNLYCHKFCLCKGVKGIMCAIFDFFENDRCFGCGYDTWLINYGANDRYYLETLSNFLVQNICEFLFEVAYEYNIDCLVNEFDGRLKFDNVGKYYLTQQECIIHCDCCGAPLNEFDFAYFCDGIHKKQKIQKIPKNPHKVCIECVCTTFNAWDELEPLLRQLLHDKLDSDCIKIIIDYVIGKICMTYIGDNIETDIVKYTTHAHENIYDENQDIINGDVEMIHDSEENISLISECEKRLVTNNSNNESISLEPLFKKRRLNNQ
eukprot:350123_1